MERIPSSTSVLGAVSTRDFIGVFGCTLDLSVIIAGSEEKVRIDWDGLNNLAYIHVADELPKGKLTTHRVQPLVHIDVDESGDIVGIELLNPYVTALEDMAKKAKITIRKTG